MQLLFKSTILVSLLALSAFSMANADEGLQRVNLRGGASAQPDLDAIAPVEGDIALEKFKREHALLQNANVARQNVSAFGTFKANGRKYDLTDLQPLNVFSRDATYMEEGITQPLEDDSRRGRLYMKKGENGETILVTMVGGAERNQNDKVESIEVFGHDGSEAYMEALEDGTLGTIRKEDRDFSQLERFNFGGFGGEQDEVPADGTFVDGLDGDESLVPQTLGGDRRQLQEGACSSYKVIDVAIAYDSTFCSQVAGGSAAQARSIVEQTVARASQMYEQLCVRVRVSHLEGYCSSSGDPYRQTMSYGTIGCSNSYGVLQAFRDYWNANRRNVSRDTAHLFFGKDLPGSVIGCASTPSLCESSSYGANEMSYTSDAHFRGILFAHELGHNAGAGHFSSSTRNYIMEPSINSGSDGFSSQSRSSIQSYLDTRNCVATENGGGGGGGGSPGGFRLESAQHRGQCISVQGAASNGTPVNLAPCNDSAASQSWSWDAQTHLISTLMGSNKCLYPSGSSENGANMLLWDCDPRYTYAEWSYYTDSTLRPDYNTGKCIDVWNSDGRTLQMWDCNGTLDKKWIVR